MRELRTKPDDWRNLRAGELALWWTASAPRVIPRPSSGMVQELEVAVLVERADGSGKQLRAVIRGQRAVGLRSAAAFTVEPSAVRELVERVAPRGAWPTGTGTITAELTLVGKPLPAELAFHLEHLAGATVLVK